MPRGARFRNEALAAEWTALRTACRKYRFGGVELMPIKKTGEAVARYVAGLLRKFTDLALDESAQARWQEFQATEADKIQVGPGLKTDFQLALPEASAELF